MNQSPSRLWTAGLYTGMVMGSIGLFLLIRDFGKRLSAPPALGGVSSAGPAPAAAPDILFHVLLAPAAVLVAGRSVGMHDQWLACGVIVVVATLGKFGGTLAAARLTGMDWRQGSTLGILMNTRGLMELVVLNIGLDLGLDLGIISPTLFAMLVIMALVTTLATTPLLQLVNRDQMIKARSDSWLANIG
jgi:hypothetical protein